MGGVEGDRGGELYLDLPEALGYVNGGVVDRSAGDEGLLDGQHRTHALSGGNTHIIDVAESVAWRHIVDAVGQVSREDLRVLLDITLDHHVLNRRVDRSWLDGVDGAKGKAAKTITLAADKRIGHVLSQLDCLAFDRETADADRVSSNGALRSGPVTVLDLLAFTWVALPRAGLGRVEDGVAGFGALLEGVLRELG